MICDHCAEKIISTGPSAAASAMSELPKGEIIDMVLKLMKDARDLKGLQETIRKQPDDRY